jgi:hypothetical protein
VGLFVFGCHLRNGVEPIGEEAISYAHAVKIEALAQLGKMLDGMEKNTGQRGEFMGGSKGEPPLEAPPTGSMPEPVEPSGGKRHRGRWGSL